MTKKEAKKLQVGDIVLVRKGRRLGKVLETPDLWDEDDGYVLLSILYTDTNRQVWKRHRQIEHVGQE